MKRWHFVLGLLFAALLAGCDDPAPPAELLANPFEPPMPTRAQPKLPTMKIYVGAKELQVELALTPDQQRTGMMFRTSVEENGGMLFPLFSTQRAGFWMKNCPSPLSVAYIDPEGIIREIHDLEPHNTNAVVSASDNIRFVLETQRGWFKKNEIKEGTSVATERGPLMQTFFGRR
jgi:uncharacterized membrane protein (UPF0127 family)